jgi:phage tail sheath protein FI
MATYKTPGVYVEEISSLPPSVAEVSTAIPAFIGYTDKGYAGEGPVIARINTLLEYEELFGKAKPAKFKIQTDTDPKTGITVVAGVEHEKSLPDPERLMYYCVNHYFKMAVGAATSFRSGATASLFQGQTSRTDSRGWRKRTNRR